MNYSFKWRRLGFGQWFYQSENSVIGHGYIREFDKLVVRYSGGRLKEIPEWSRCEFKAGADYHAAEQEALNKQAGQTVPVAKL